MSNSDASISPRRRAPVPKDVCPMALAAEIIGDRWTLLILREAFYGVVRYDDMLADLGAPRSMLTDRLTRLVGHGLMMREPYQEPGSRTRQAYVLTDKGRALGLTLIALSQWGEENVIAHESPVRFVDRQTRARLQVGLVNPSGEQVAFDRVQIRLRDP